MLHCVTSLWLEIRGRGRVEAAIGLQGRARLGPDQSCGSVGLSPTTLGSVLQQNPGSSQIPPRDIWPFFAQATAVFKSSWGLFCLPLEAPHGLLLLCLGLVWVGAQNPPQIAVRKKSMEMEGLGYSLFFFSNSQGHPLGLRHLSEPFHSLWATDKVYFHFRGEKY